MVNVKWGNFPISKLYLKIQIDNNQIYETFINDKICSKTNKFLYNI